MLENFDLTEDVWELTSNDVRRTDWSESILVFTSQSLIESGGLDVEGYFEWIGSNGSFGREDFQGTVSADGFFEVTSSDLSPPTSGIVTSNYVATLSKDATTLLNGSWSGGINGDFIAQREGANYIRMIIDFERLPGGEAPLDGQAISDQFVSTNQIRFSQLNGNPATIAQAGGTATAFLNNSEGADLVLSNRQAEVGTFFLTDDGSLSGLEAGIAIDFVEPASEIRGALLDIDFDEEWIITAFDSSGQTIDTETIASGDPFTGNGMLTNFVVQTADGENGIDRVEFAGNRDTAGSFGFAIDNLAIERLSNPSNGSGDSVDGSPGDDSISANPGDETIDGGPGTDTVVFSGAQSHFTLTLGSEAISITDRRADGSGTDTLVNIEFLDFDTDLLGSPFNLQQFGGPTSLSASDFESFIELYIAYFNRAPDAVGLNFWGTAFANGTSLEDMATLFVDQDETRSTYPNETSNTEFATSVYNNVLGRTPDQSGIDFWVSALNSNAVSRDQFILEVLRGAKADLKPAEGQAFVDQQIADRAYLENKVDIGAYFAVHRGMSDVDNATAAMALFDGTQNGIDQAVAAINGYYQQALDPVNGEFLMQVVGILEDPFTM